MRAWFLVPLGFGLFAACTQLPSEGSAGAGASPPSAGGASAGGDTAAGGAAPTGPDCDFVSGTVGVTFSIDGGETLAPVVGPPPSNIAYSNGIAFGDEPEILYADVDSEVIRSDDAGCHWGAIGPGSSSLLLYGGRPDLLYGLVQTIGLYRYSTLGYADLGPVPSGQGADGLFVDPADGAHIFYGGRGAIGESHDAGSSWTEIWAEEKHSTFVFAPDDPSVILATAFGISLERSVDGGHSWKPSTLIAPQGMHPEPSLPLDYVFSTFDSSVAWLVGRTVAEPQTYVLYYSSDGGASFAEVAREPEATSSALRNARLTPSPFDRDVVVLSAIRKPNSAISTFDLGSRELVIHPHYDVLTGRVAFSPVSPSVLYVPLSYEGHSD